MGWRWDFLFSPLITSNVEWHLLVLQANWQSQVLRLLGKAKRVRTDLTSRGQCCRGWDPQWKTTFFWTPPFGILWPSTIFLFCQKKWDGSISLGWEGSSGNLVMINQMLRNDCFFRVGSQEWFQVIHEDL